MVMFACASMVLGFQFSVSSPAQAQELLLPASWAARQTETVAPKSAAAVSLPFFDDFSNYCGAPNPLLWDAGGTLVNTGFGPLAPTVGVLTLDALDANGCLYEQASASLFPADTAMSLPIRLDSLTAGDSVVMSFYYLPGGGSGNLWERVGDVPESGDSLFLEFYAAADSQWHTVWSRGGVSVDSLLAATGRSWQYVAIAISDSMYFDSAFRFRFRNFCSIEDNGKPGMAGAGDQWNIDYVVIDFGRTVSETPEFRDVAFVEQAPSMLRHYQAMPARQYRAQEMADTMRLTITNLYSSALATQYGYAVVDEEGDTLYRYDGGYENAPPFLPDGSYQTSQAHAAPAVGYSFEQSDTPREYTVVHTVREGVGGDGWQRNDTVRFVQRFDNCYAYDDGSAENGYGLTSTASRVYLAYRFDLNVQDTLTAVDMMFNPVLGGANEAIQFHITVWREENGMPATVLYRDVERRRPTTGSGFNRYVLENEVTVDGSIFVGFEQVGNNYINIGFDRNTNSSDRIYYLTSTAWQQSILRGSLMLRPYFGQSATEGIAGATTAERIVVCPNPTHGPVSLEGLPEGSAVQLYDMQGRMVLSVHELSFDVTGLKGVFLLRAITPDGCVFTEKLIVD